MDREKNRAAVRKHYQENKEYYFEKNQRAKERKRQYVLKLKAQPCTDCGQTYPHYVMEFDHLKDKKDCIGKLLSNSWKKLKEELAKCELVCANCHSVRTWKRRCADVDQLVGVV